jgi:hypothetical protein
MCSGKDNGNTAQRKIWCWDFGFGNDLGGKKRRLEEPILGNRHDAASLGKSPIIRR